MKRPILFVVTTEGRMRHAYHEGETLSLCGTVDVTRYTDLDGWRGSCSNCDNLIGGTRPVSSKRIYRPRSHAREQRIENREQRRAFWPTA